MQGAQKAFQLVSRHTMDPEKIGQSRKKWPKNLAKKKKVARWPKKWAGQAAGSKHLSAFDTQLVAQKGGMVFWIRGLGVMWDSCQSMAD